MKITKKYLRRIIKEEATKLLRELHPEPTIGIGQVHQDLGGDQAKIVKALAHASAGAVFGLAVGWAVSGSIPIMLIVGALHTVGFYVGNITGLLDLSAEDAKNKLKAQADEIVRRGSRAP